MAKDMVHGEAGVRSSVMAAMSYLGILCLVPLTMNKDDEFVYFHARQGLVIWIWSVLAVMALHLPGIGKSIFSISAFAVLALSLAGVAAVLLRKAWKLPLVHTVAAKI
ncbi:MAG: hypothetical protein V3R66_03385 [Rhodospirillales bacterium]